ncbi:MAG: electron transfer flavoprotein subunit beta/FixA family protein [Thermoplasmata archaeon]
MRNIIVCMKVVPKSDAVFFDPVTKRLDRTKAENQINDADKNALETALKIKEKYGGKVIVLSMGPQFFDQFLKVAIAMGADDAILLSDRLFGGSDTFPTALILSTAIKKIGDYDIILTGEESSDAGLGQLPAQIAEFLELPQVLFVSSMDLSENKIIARRTIKGGYEIVETDMPAVLSIELGINQPRFPDFRRKRWADKEFQLKVWSNGDLGLSEDEVGLKGSYTSVRRLVEIQPSTRKKIFIEGTSEEKVEKMIEIINERMNK